MAARLDGQDSGTLTRGRRTSDRGAYARFSRAVHDAHCSRFITPRLDSELFAFDLNEAAIKKAEQFDGKLILVTNVRDLTAQEVVGRYKALADIERGFRVLKRDLEIAPVYHYKPDRIRAHGLICFMALILHRVMRAKLRQAPSSTSVERALDQLRGIQLHTITLGQRTFNGLTRLSASHQQLFKALEVEPPSTSAL